MRGCYRTLLVQAGVCLLIAGATSMVCLAQSPAQLNAPTQIESLALPDLMRLTVERHPRLAQVAFAVDEARGRAIQAGLCPNPRLSITGNELGDRTGPGGIWSAPFVSQEIVTARKLGLSRAAAGREVDQATLTVIAERYRVFTDVRQKYFELVALQRRTDILTELVILAAQTVENTQRLLDARQVARLYLVQLEVDLERYRAELEATQRALPAAFRRLAASVGVSDRPYAPVAGSLETPLPKYDLERVRGYVLGIHPDVRSAQIGVERAQLLLQRARAEPIPNVTLSAGYTRQNQNKSSDWDIGVSVPVWNRNQGNIHAAQAQVGIAIHEIGRVQNNLVNRLASEFGTHAAARQRADRYRTSIPPRARETHKLSLRAYQGRAVRVSAGLAGPAHRRRGEPGVPPVARRDVACGQRDRRADARRPLAAKPRPHPAGPGKEMTMRLPRFAKPLVVIAVVGGLAAAGYATYDRWMPLLRPAKPAESVEAPDETAAPLQMVIVTELAQRNLGLTAKPLKAQTFWKTIPVPGMVVDRPGLSDRNVVAPVTGIVAKVAYVPGDTVRPGDTLFVFRLLSESMHLTQTELFKTTQDIKLAQAQRRFLTAPGASVPETRIIEVDNQIARLQSSDKAYRQELLNRGLAPEQIDGAAEGRFVREITARSPHSPPTRGQ